MWKEAQTAQRTSLLFCISLLPSFPTTSIISGRHIKMATSDEGSTEDARMDPKTRESPSSSSSDSSSSASSPGSSVHDEAPTPTQGAIKKLLEVPSLPAGQGLVEAMLLLKHLEKRKLASDLKLDHFDVGENPRSCCFDSVRRQASWSVHQICQRCAAFNQVLQGKYVDSFGQARSRHGKLQRLQVQWRSRRSASQ